MYPKSLDLFKGTESIRNPVSSYLSQFVLIVVNSYSIFGQFDQIFEYELTKKSMQIDLERIQSFLRVGLSVVCFVKGSSEA